MTGELVTVIVPVYNTKKYLEKCIRSIMEQTYENLEIILVDDGSTDGSEEICDKLAKEDKRITVIHKENAGLSDTRNKGIQASHGRFLSFVDCDDFICPQKTERMVALAEKYHADIVKCAAFTEEMAVNDKDTVKVRVLDRNTALEEILTDRMDNFVWDKFYKRELFDGAEFDVNLLVEDMMMMPTLFAKAEIVVDTPEKLHFYRCNREDNISNAPKNRFKNVYCRALSYQQRIFDWDSYGVREEIRREVVAKAFSFTESAYLQMVSGAEEKSYDIKPFLEFMKVHWKEVLGNEYLEKGKQIVGFLIVADPFHMKGFAKIRNRIKGYR